MPGSKQTPLTAPRGGDSHDFTLALASYEAAVFDQASHFRVVMLRRRESSEFTVFPWAVRYASRHDDACVYAVTESGRHCLLDREKLSEWETRWWRERRDGA